MFTSFPFGDALRSIRDDTLDSSSRITESMAAKGATTSSTFYHESDLRLLSPADSPSLPPPTIKVLNSDTCAAARTLLSEIPDATFASTAILNLASDQRPGGGWIDTLSISQEEALCYSSTLYSTLQKSWYPWPNTGTDSASGAFSPGVVVWKDTLSNHCTELPRSEWIVVGVITVAAPRSPRLTRDRSDFASASDLDDMRRKIRNVMRIAAVNGRRDVVLGALGCGAYACPREAVAREMKAVLREKEWEGWFRSVWMAVVDPVGDGNMEVFGRVLDGVKMEPEEGWTSRLIGGLLR